MVKAETGFTFIELLIVLLIMGLLALVAVPLTSAWVDEAAVIEARGLVHQAHGQAKALALRNPAAVLGDNVAASIKLNGGILMVCQGVPSAADCTSGGASVSWQANWPTVVTTSFADVRLNNRGQILLSGSPIHAGLTFTLTARSVTDDSAFNRLR